MFVLPVFCPIFLYFCYRSGLRELWATIAKLLITEGVTTIKPGHQKTGKAWYDQMSHCHLPCSLHQEEFAFEEYPKKQVYSPEYPVPTVKHIMGEILWYHDILLVPLLPSHCWITAKEYMDRLGNQVMIQTLFLNDVWSWFEEHIDELHCLPWPAHSNTPTTRCGHSGN
jgi:hypothetical protein